MKAKRMLAILLSVLMLVSLLPVSALAADAALTRSMTVDPSRVKAADPLSEADVDPAVQIVGDPVRAPLTDQIPETVVIPAAKPAAEDTPEPASAVIRRADRTVPAAAETSRPAEEKPAANRTNCTLSLFVQPSLEAGSAIAYPGGMHYVGQTVTLIAVPKSGYHFFAWVNYETEEFSFDSQHSITLEGDCEWDALFIRDGEYFIYVNKPLDMTVSPNTYSYVPGTQITLTAPPKEGRSIVYELGEDVDGFAASANWTRIGSDGTFAMPAAHTWTRALYSNFITVTSGAHGTFTLTPGPYYEGGTATITLIPDEGCYARSISGIPEGYTISGNSITFPTDEDLDIFVEFAQIPAASVSFGVFPSGKGSVNHSLNEETGEITAEAVPADGFTLLYWMKCDQSTGACTALSGENPYVFVPQENMLLVAVFGFLYPEEGGSVQTVIEKNGDVTLTAVPTPGYQFLFWMSIVDQEILTYDAAYTTPPRLDIALAAAFQQGTRRIYTYDMQPDRGSFTVSPSQPFYTPGQTIELQASPAEGYALETFLIAEYQEGVTNYNMTPIDGSSFVMPDYDVLVMTAFCHLYTISAEASPMEGGFAVGGGQFKENETVTLAAVPNDGWRFVSWTENGNTVSTDAEYSFTAAANRTLTANFEPIPAEHYTISAFADPTEGGTVTGAGEYVEGASVTLTAAANVGSHCVNWTVDGSVVSTDAEYSFTAAADRTLTANFESNPVTYYTISVAAEPAEGGTVTGAGEYAEGATVTLTAEPNEGYRFVSWTENGETISTGRSYVFPAAADRSLTANFEASSLIGDGTAENPYLIGSRDNLLEFAQLVNSDIQPGAWAIQTANIDLENEPWEPIGNNTPYLGVYDGQLHRITSLNVNVTSNDGILDTGLFGKVGDYNQYAAVKNLQVSGSVAGTGTSESRVGGVVGAVYIGAVENCSFDGTVTVHQTGNSGYGIFAGGIVGGCTSGTVRCCTHSGDVSAVGSHITFAGGISGTASSATVENCSHTGGAVYAESGGSTANAGGVVGEVYNSGVLSCSFSAGGPVTAAGGSSNYAGGVVGLNHATVANCYYLNGTAAGGENGTDTPGVAMPLTAEQLRNQSSFVNWDFETIWFMGSNWPVLWGLTLRIPYLDPTDENKPNKICADPTPLIDQTTLETGWYVVNADATISDRITVSGDVNIILCDGVTLNAGSGVNVNEGNSLTLWAQSYDEETAGKLIAVGNGGSASGNSGIGGGRKTTCGTVTINGGVISATGFSWAAGIGGGGGTGSSGTTTNGGHGGIVTVNAGTVYAYGGHRAAGIGGANGSNGGSFTMNGGKVIANSNGAQAIGCGQRGTDPGSLTIDGIKVFASEDGTPVAAANRENTCRSGWAMLEPCAPHSYDEHTGVCICCGTGGGPVPYLDENGAEQICETYTILRDESTLTAEGWYVLNEDTMIMQTDVYGDVRLILLDGCSLFVPLGITVEEGNSLTIYAQSDGDNMGALFAGTTDGTDAHLSNNQTAIGAAEGKAGTITINGGRITARGCYRGAAIGGNRFNNVTAITINGGYVTAIGGEWSAGIGCGPDYQGEQPGSIVINGGTVQAIGGEHSAAIGGSTNASSCNVEINGGTVYATGGVDGAGIGGGQYYETDAALLPTGKVTISGGEVYAVGSDGAPGIGAGDYGNGCDVTITGGTVTAVAGADSQAIGRGRNATESGSLDIPNMKVYAFEEAEEPVAAAEREAACRGVWAKLTRCGHEEAACTYNGETHTILCPACGYEAISEAHSYGEVSYNWADDHSACTASHVCSVCTYEESEETASITVYVTQAPTCTDTGKTTYTATFTNPAFAACSEELVDIPALGHDLIHHDAQAPTCFEIGWEAYDNCSRCDYSTYAEIPALGHDLIHHDAQAPTCTTAGWEAYDSCSRCDFSSYEELPALGHNWDEGVETVPATHQAPGVKVFTCVRCSVIEEREIAQLANPFVDVAETNYFFNPVMWALDNEVTAGVDDTHFGPKKTCTRAQIVTFLWKASGSPEPVSTVNPFVDVKEGKYYFKAVLWAVENGITNGVNAKNFGVNKPCTRAQAMTFLWKACGSPEPTTTENPFTDVQAGKYYSKPILWAVENGITSGTSATTFGVNKTCTRGQIVTFLYKAFNLP